MPMTCPRCSVSEISPVTGRCDLCGYSVVAAVATESADALSDLAKRQLAHEFSFGDLMGRGKESVVYRARERGSGRDVVLKAILRRNAEPEVAESFRALMATLSGFDHPHLVPILRHGSTDSLFWFATEYRGDVSLAFKMRAEGALDLKACRRVLQQLVGALDYLHRHGLVHGAVKSENVFVDREGWIRLGDPNFVRPRWRRPARPAPAVPQLAVTDDPAVPVAHWVSPEEQARGERQPAADQYALAVLAVECLLGSEAETLGIGEALDRIGRELPPRIRRTLERALDEIPTRRYPTVTDFLWALEEDAAASVTSPARRVTTEVMMVKDWEPPADPGRPLRIVGRVTVVLLVAVAIAAVTPAARDLLWPEPVATRPAPSPVATTATAPAPVVATPPRLGAPRPATDEPSAPRAELRDSARVLPPSSIARPRTAPSTTPPAPADRATPAVSPVPATSATETGAATLFVNATPWGQVFVDGTLIGNTPRANIALTAGSHTIRVNRTGFATWERTIRVTAGETVRFTDIVLTPERP
jgi:Protein kinase domain/PEGA domain